jgi:hypothetical protein
VRADRPPPRARRRRPRPERLLPFACIVAAAVLFASEFMTTFQLTRGDLVSGNASCSVEAASRHHFAVGVLAIFAVLAVIVAVQFASKPAAIGVAIAGGLALLLFLIIDLPDANDVGTLADSCTTDQGSLFNGKAVPQAGFWLEMVGAVALALSGAVLATLTSDQLAALRPRLLGGPRDDTTHPTPPVGSTSAIPNPDPAPDSDSDADADAGSSADSSADPPTPTRRARRG